VKRKKRRKRRSTKKDRDFAHGPFSFQRAFLFRRLFLFTEKKKPQKKPSQGFSLLPFKKRDILLFPPRIGCDDKKPYGRS
jgi:hypothetical protein